MTFVLQLLVGTFPGLPNTDKKTSPSKIETLYVCQVNLFLLSGRSPTQVLGRNQQASKPGVASFWIYFNFFFNVSIFSSTFQFFLQRFNFFFKASIFSSWCNFTAFNVLLSDFISIKVFWWSKKSAHLVLILSKTSFCIINKSSPKFLENIATSSSSSQPSQQIGT